MATSELALSDVFEALHPERGFWREAWGRLRQSRAAIVGLYVIGLFVLLAVLAPLVAPYCFSDGNLLHVTEGPSAQHWLGTDDAGRDILSRLRFGAQVSLAVAVAAQAVILLEGV